MYVTLFTEKRMKVRCAVTSSTGIRKNLAYRQNISPFRPLSFPIQTRQSITFQVLSFTLYQHLQYLAMLPEACTASSVVMRRDLAEKQTTIVKIE